MFKQYFFPRAMFQKMLRIPSILLNTQRLLKTGLLGSSKYLQINYFYCTFTYICNVNIYVNLEITEIISVTVQLYIRLFVVEICSYIFSFSVLCSESKIFYIVEYYKFYALGHDRWRKSHSIVLKTYHLEWYCDLWL